MHSPCPTATRLPARPSAPPTPRPGPRRGTCRAARLLALGLAVLAGAPAALALPAGRPAPADPAGPVARSFPAAPAAPASAARDAGDEQYRFLAGLVEKELWDLAVKEGQAFLRAHPGHAKAPLARYRLATALFELERLEEAAPHYRTLAAARGFEYRAEAAFRVGQCDLAAGRLDEAREALAGVLAGEQDYLHGPALFLLGETELRAARHAEAEEHFQRLLREHPGSEHAPEAQRALAWCAWEREEAEEAVKRIRAWLERHGNARDDDEMRVLLGEALLELDRAEEALAAYRAALGEGADAGPFADAALRGAGFARAALGDAAGAAEEFGRLLERFPKSRYAAEARLQRGIQQLQAGDAAAAVESLAGTDARDPQALLWLARARRAAGDPQAALRTLDQALALSPPPALASRLQVARGEVLGDLGRGEEAVAAFERAGSDYALHAAAVTALNEGDAESAARLATTLLAEHPASDYRAQTALVLGEALFAREEHARAEEALLELLATPSDELGETAGELVGRALSRVAWCRYLQGDPAGAAQRFEELVRRFPGRPEAEEARWMLGRALAEAGDEPAAARARAAYLAEHPEGEHVAEVLLAHGLAREDDEGGRHLARLVEGHAGSPLAARALLVLGDRASDAGEALEAERHYRRLLDEHAGHELAPQARYGLAWCLYGRGEHAAAAQELDALQAAAAGSNGSAALEGELALAADELAVWAHGRAGAPRKALAAWQRLARACEDDRRSFRAARAVVEAFRAAGEDEAARKVLDELLGGLRDPDVAVEVLVEGAYLALEDEDVDRAEAQVRVALRRTEAPAVREAAFYVAEALFAAGRDQRAIELYAVARGAPELAPQALYKLGFALLRTGDLEGAEGALAALVTEHPTSDLRGEGLFLLGETRFRQERWREAAEPLETLRRELPRHEVLPKALFRLGLALGHAEEWAAAEAVLSDLARRAPQFENLLEAELWRARALAAQGKARAARQAFERVAAEDRGELAADAHLGLGRLDEAEERFEDALAEYLKVAVLYGHAEKVAEGLYRAGLCLERLGDVEKAVAQYREVLADHRESPFAALARERLDAIHER